jgi:hypothetical protein
MRRWLSALTISIAVAAVMQLASLDPWPAARAEAPDDNAPTDADVAASAGTAAGIVESCGVDVAPISSAFNEFLAGTKLASSNQESLLRQYKTAEVAALSVRSEDNPDACGGAASIIRDTVRGLTNAAS